mmetsp:Transcript_46264/g.53598  ORF Transcript_46264/g.53598 Transcript_46264/m.53598 type:complete len:148 (-) Transcript_46264:28-471(-)
MVLLETGRGNGDDTRGYAVAAERFVFEELSKRYANRPEIVVKWMHAEGEQGTPYDVVVLEQTPGGRPRIQQLIEVKSTSTKHRKDFEMSLREFLFAAKFGRQFAVARVFRATESASHHMSMEMLVDPVTMWRTGSLSITAEVKVVAS